MNNVFPSGTGLQYGEHWKGDDLPLSFSPFMNFQIPNRPYVIQRYKQQAITSTSTQVDRMPMAL